MNSRPSGVFPSLAAILPLALALAACQPAGEDEAATDVEPANETAFNLPSVPLPQPPMDRAELLAAVARAASAAAAGADDRDVQRSLDGSQFELRIRFGCRGPVPDLADAVLGWTFDREARTLRVRATLTIDEETAMIEEILARIEGEQFEAVEGFWIPRPWLLDPVCPAAAAVRPAPAEDQTAGEDSDSETPPAPAPAEDQQETEAPPPAWPKVGIAQFFRDNDPRTRRRQMRPYETVKTIEPDRPIGSQGFNLVLSGRLRSLPGRGPIACVRQGADNPPNCIVSADFHRVWIEQADTKEILAQWGG